MRFDDPLRPVSDYNAVKTALQINRSPLPVITLLYPMKEGTENYKVCTGAEGCTGPEEGTDESCQVCRIEETGEWGWLACIHAHKGSNAFGTHYGFVRDLGEFQRTYLDDPEGTLLRYFKYAGPDYEPTERALKPKHEINEEIF